jgi:hypothetical protein
VVAEVELNLERLVALGPFDLVVAADVVRGA